MVALNQAKARRRFFVAAACLFAWLGSSSCRRGEHDERGEHTPPTSLKADRIVSLSPSTTETLFAVGAGKQVVGRSKFCDYPPEAKSLPSVGGFVDVSLEAVLALRPDLVVGARGPSGPALADKLRGMGIATLFPKAESMAEIDAMIVEVADRVGHHDEGARVATQLAKRRASIAIAVAGEPRVRALLVFGTTPIVVAGPGSFANEILTLANAENVVTDGNPYPMLSVERLLAVNPDVVLNAAMGAKADAIGKDDPGFRELAAVREGRVVPITDEAVLRPGPRIADGLATVAHALHPRVTLP